MQPMSQEESTLSFRPKPPLGSLVNPHHPLADKLVGCWIMNEGGGDKVFDLGKRGLHLSAGGTPEWGIGERGQNVILDGVSEDYFQIEVAALSSHPITMLCWFNPDADDNNETLLWVGDKASQNYGTGIDYNGTEANDPVEAFSYNAPGQFYASVYETNGFANTWHQLVGVFASNTSRLVYFDGKPGTEDTNNSVPSGYDRTSIGALRRPADTGYFSGKIACAMIWNRVLTENEIQQLFANPYAMFEPIFDPMLFGYVAGVGVNAPTGALYGPLLGPMGGPI